MKEFDQLKKTRRRWKDNNNNNKIYLQEMIKEEVDLIPLAHDRVQ
jgi:hypothetical protein